MEKIDPTPWKTAHRRKQQYAEFVQGALGNAALALLLILGGVILDWPLLVLSAVSTVAVMAAGGALFVRYYLLPKFQRPIWFSCPHCGKHISSHCKWRCGYCNTENPAHKNVWQSSILGTCGRCPGEAKNVRCPYCSASIPLWGDPDDRHIAILMGMTPDPTGAVVAHDSAAERNAKLAEESAQHAANMKLVEQQTQWFESQARRVMAEKRLNEAMQSGVGQKTALDDLMKEITDADARNKALRKFMKDRTREINSDDQLDDDEKNDLRSELNDLVAETRSKFL